MASLYTLTQEFLEIAAQLEDLDIDEETIGDTLESLQIPIEIKAENIIRFTKNIEAMAEARKAEAKRLNELAAKDIKKAASLINYLDDTLKILGKSKLTAGIFEVKYKKGSEVVQVDESKLPMEYHVQKYVPMGKTELKWFIKEEGREIPGVSIVRNPDKLVIK